jgi:hypothetical protein
MIIMMIIMKMIINIMIMIIYRSYLKPCGHPWAALVMFDSVLVSVYKIIHVY